ncbi:hypothetical protein BSKO_03844 [Bryopsis sp. KO-2023]|nr:hypothetical protein BSKO_03844 [Bryopsis sp. KO-2023]
MARTCDDMAHEVKIDPTALWSEVPWSTPVEFKELRDCLLSKRWQKVKRGLEQVEAWKKADKEVPLKVEATCFLLQAFLRDPGNTPCSESIDALGGPFTSGELGSAYALAIVRVVSSIVDPIRRQVPVNMDVIAESEGFPMACLEVRHGIVHNKMPSLEELQRGAKDCLTYLTKHFWDAMCDWYLPSRDKVEKELREFFNFHERLNRRRTRKSGSRVWGKRLRDSSSEGEENVEDGNGNPRSREEMSSLKGLEVQKQVMRSSASIQALTNASMTSVTNILLEKFSPQDHLEGLGKIIELCPKAYSALLEQFVARSVRGKQSQGHWFGWLTAGESRSSLLSKADHKHHMMHLVRSCHPATPTHVISEGGAGTIKALLGWILDSGCQRGYLVETNAEEIRALANDILEGAGKVDPDVKRKRIDPGFIPLIASKEDSDGGGIGLEEVEASEERERKLSKFFEGGECEEKKEVEKKDVSKKIAGGRDVLVRRIPSSFEKNSADIPLAPVTPKSSTAPPSGKVLKFRGNMMYTLLDVVGDAYCRGIPPECKTIGFDIEWRPQYEKGKPQRKTALVQLCYSMGKEGESKYHCVLVHVFHCGVPEGLKILLANPDIKKVGVNVFGDARKLEHDYGLEVEGCVDISTEAMSRVLPGEGGSTESFYKLKSLKGLCEVLLGEELAKDKKIRCGNWESLPLSETQMRYGATDAYASLKCYQALLSLPKAEIPPITVQSQKPPDIDIGLRTGGAEDAGYVPELASVQYLPLSKDRVYKMFMGTDAIRKHSLTEIFQAQRIKPATMLTYISSAILSGRGYDWKRLGIKEELVLSVGRVFLEKLFPEDPVQEKTAVASQQWSSPPGGDATTRAKKRKTELEIAEEKAKENGASVKEGGVEEKVTGSGDEILEEVVDRIRGKLRDDLQPDHLVDFRAFLKKRNVRLLHFKESLDVEAEFAEILVALAHLARLVGLSHQEENEAMDMDLDE